MEKHILLMQRISTELGTAGLNKVMEKCQEMHRILEEKELVTEAPSGLKEVRKDFNRLIQTWSEKFLGKKVGILCIQKYGSLHHGSSDVIRLPKSRYMQIVAGGLIFPDEHPLSRNRDGNQKNYLLEGYDCRIIAIDDKPVHGRKTTELIDFLRGMKYFLYFGNSAQ